MVLQQHAGDDVGIADRPHRVQRIALCRQRLLHRVAVADALFGQIHRLLQQPLDRDALFPRQWGVRRGDEEDVFRPLGDLDPFGKVDLLVEEIQDIHIVLAQHLDQIGDARGVRDDLHLRTQRGQLGEHGRQHADDKGFAGADPQLAGDLRGFARDVFRLPDRAQYLERIGQQPLARLCQLDLLADPLEQLHMQLAFQLLDLHGHCGLRVAELLRSAGKILRFRDPDKGHKVSDLHTITIKNFEYNYQNYEFYNWMILW